MVYCEIPTMYLTIHSNSLDPFGYCNTAMDLNFVGPCIANIAVNDDQQYATILWLIY